MNLNDKFEIGKESKTYQRIDGSNKVDIYLGYNDDGNMSLVITEKGRESKVKSSQLINVGLNRRNDGKYALSFDLIDENFKSIFLIFCNDIINVCEKVGKEMAISTAITRWGYWREMFRKRTSNILTIEEIKGLIAELIVLKEIFIPKYGEEKAIKSWMGPLSGHKDFEVDSTWYETKGISENALYVTISSLEQLESDVDGHLIVTRLEKTSETNSLAINLNSMVADVIGLIEDVDILELFKTKLEAVQYYYSDEYFKYCFVKKGLQSYLVNNNFPRIRRKDVHYGIGNVKYTILLDSIVDAKEKN